MSRRLALLLVVAGVVIAGGGYWLIKSRAASLAPQTASSSAPSAPASSSSTPSSSETKPAASAAAPQGVPVVLGTAETRSLPVRVDTIGRVDAYATVSVKSQVDGPLLEVHFREGQQVAKGDLLFTIDPAPFLAELHAAQANLAKDQAQLASAQADMARYKALAGSGYASQQKDEQARATVDTLNASIKADEAAVESAQLKLGYSQIRSPIDGRTGSYEVDAGNLVKANDTTPLVVINQTKPVYIVCSVPERHLAEIQDRMAQGGLTIEASVPDSETPPVTGKVVFVDNQVDMSTGTIRLKAEIPNEDERLLPGQFLRVTLALRELNDVVAVPDAAVQIGQQGTYVYVIGADDKAELRTIHRGPSFDGYTAVGDGITAGERVVIDGHMNLYPGALVAPKPGT
ncbi:MAG TPA: efflux RND transporter periplasmic adaptor subunit [Hypericibacter adhaerens]|uniref:efflux RND transporter periplasmic adaptor subunit n=1 Tax=Hypericibacter adhaerens TaxID=2602016 RepID=UPI002C0B8BD3|nr:efflux RND transporter periplasmic adaptor subunit [Hypericibacter adhaerens]HWA44967.1 efflux RND transporter periplasmic adaptor subunit [Hypericibacter adhaerens]